MGNLVRRVASQPSVQQIEGGSGNTLPARVHRTGGISVESQLSLGVEPALRLAWNIIPTYWQKGFTLLVFRSTTGFSPQKHPEDLNSHGQLIIETTRDDCYAEHPQEGSHYFTFLLHKTCLFGLSEKMSILRFSETIPTAKVGLGRIRDKIDLQAMLQKHELDQIEHEANLHEAELRLIHSRKRLKVTKEPTPPSKQTAGDETIANEIAAVDAIVETLIAKREKLQALKRDPKFKKLRPKERKAVMDTIEQRLDPAEISASREMRGS